MTRDIVKVLQFQTAERRKWTQGKKQIQPRWQGETGIMGLQALSAY